jgi:hypothetical protein
MAGLQVAVVAAVAGVRRSVAARCVVALCVAAVCLCSAAPADAFVYWANSVSQGLGRADLDGSNQTRDFIDGTINASGVAVDGAHIYWSNRGGNSIGRANLDGSGADQNFITGAQLPDSVAVDGAHVYWNNNTSLRSIGRANLDGSSPDQTFISQPSFGVFPVGNDFGTNSIAVDAAHIYWAGGSRIGRANLDGTAASLAFITLTNGARSVSVDATHIYWGSGHTIGQANIDGSGVNEGFIGVSGLVEGLAVDAAHIYWTSPSNAIGRANLDGTNPEPTFITCVAVSTGVAVDSLSSPAPSPFPGCPGLPRPPLAPAAASAPGPTSTGKPSAAALTPSIAGKSPFKTKVAHGLAVFPITISCPKGSSACTATLTLRTNDTRRRLLAKDKVAVRAGTRRTVRMRLGSSARRLLSRRRSLRAKLAITARQGATHMTRSFIGRLVS